MSALLGVCLVAYVLALPLWATPLVIARRSKEIEPLARRLAIWFAALSPAVAAIGFLIGNAYCRRGSTAMGFSGSWWPQCNNTEAAWLIMLAPATFMGLAAWVFAFNRPDRRR